MRRTCVFISCKLTEGFHHFFSKTTKFTFCNNWKCSNSDDGKYDGIRMLSLDYKEDPVGTIDALMRAVDAAEPEGVDLDEYRLRLADLTAVVNQRVRYLHLSLNRREEIRQLRAMLAAVEAEEEIERNYFHALESEFIRLASIPFSRHRKDESAESCAAPPPPPPPPPPPMDDSAADIQE